MNRKLGILAVVLCLFLALLSPGLVQAQGELTIVDSSSEVGFPYKLDFTLSAWSDVDITDIRLHYRVDRMSFARVTSEVYIDFVPAQCGSRLELGYEEDGWASSWVRRALLVDGGGCQRRQSANRSG